MTFGLLIASVNFDQVTQNLKRIKRNSNRKNDAPTGRRIVRMENSSDSIHPHVKKVEILKYKQNDKIEAYRCCKNNSPVFPCQRVHFSRAPVVDNDNAPKQRQKEGYKAHIKNAAGNQKDNPLPPDRRSKVKKRHAWKENKKLKGIEKHELSELVKVDRYYSSEWVLFNTFLGNS